MDSIEKSLQEEDAGKIPKILEAGPEILVESQNKKRRLLNDTDDTNRNHHGDEISESSHPRKKVRFNDEPVFHYIEARPPLRRSPRTKSKQSSVRDLQKSAHLTSTQEIECTSEAIATPSEQPSRLEFVTKRTISAALESPLADLRKGKGFKKRLHQALAERQIRHGVHPDPNSNENGKHQLLPSLNNEDTPKTKKPKILEPEADQPIDKRKFPFDGEDDSQRIMKRSKQYPGSSPSGSNSGGDSGCYGNREQADIPMLDVSSPPVDISAIVSTHNEPSPIDIAEDPTAIRVKAQEKSRKWKEPIVSIISKIRSRRKQSTNQRPQTSGESSIANLNKESRALTNKIPLLRRTESVINIEDEDDETNKVTSQASYSPGHIHISRAASSKFLSPADILWLRNEIIEAPMSEPPKPKPAPLSELKIYVIPKNMDSCVFDVTKKRVIDLGGSWLGPKSKTLTTDPRAKHDVPILDQGNTTHIISALKTIEEVMRYLNVEYINSKISVVSREWLSDTIMYKTPMEAQGYALQKSESTTTLAKLNLSPSPSQGCTEAAPVYQSPDGRCSSESKNSETDNQTIFNEIVQGIQEGSLHDPEFPDIVEIEEAENDMEPRAPEDGPPINKPTDPEKAIDGVEQELTSDMKSKLKHENRCFRCKEIGHWASRCPHPKPMPKDDEVLLQIINSGKIEGKRHNILYRCQSPHVAGEKDEPKHNKAILEQLKILMNHYDSIKTKDSKEHFKVINYRKAITAIRSLDYEITSEEMALKVPRVGKKIAQKIGECIAFGKMKKLNHLNWDNERSEVESLFRGVYGVGSERATEWYNKGLRTLDDLRNQKDLTKSQISGLRFYYDLLKRIPRTEVAEIGAIVDKASKEFHPDIQSQVTGSYRRGKPDCGDIDIIVTRPNIDDGDMLYDIMENTLKGLTNQGFLVDHLAWPTWSEEMENQPRHFKYMGICKLPGDDKTHRHMDILVVPWTHYGAAL
ncbi:hypothetical protein BGX26_004151, partial [Mortierella sp. AD094]